jgi:hypothetical protein
LRCYSEDDKFNCPKCGSGLPEVEEEGTLAPVSTSHKFSRGPNYKHNHHTKSYEDIK